MSSRTAISTAVIGLLIAVTISAQQSESEPPKRIQHELITELQTNPVEYRQSLKIAMQQHLQAFGLIFTMRAPDTEDLPLHAESLAWLARRQATLYPEDSKTDGTRETIWSDREAFDAAVQQSAELAQNLVTAVNGGNRHQVLGALTRLAENCEQCHGRFRAE